MKKTKNIILMCILMASGASNAQELYRPGRFFSTIFEAGRSVNSYYTGQNPAFLKWENENKEQLLSVESSYLNKDGDFRRFVDPAQERLYQLMATGRKDIDSFQTFKGSFGFQRQERRNWSWLATKDYSTDNPFLFGDSTTGNTHYNGIIMNAQYAAQLWKTILAGFELNYGVDQGLKEVAPRPTSAHRDIMIKLGLGCRITDELTVGAMGKIYDNNEEVSYKEDEGAVSKEILLLKFKGYDYPFVNKKKTEERYSYQNGAFGYLTASFIKEGFAASAYFGTGLEQITLKDDALDPQRQGYWKNSSYEGAIQSFLSLSERLSLGLYYSFKTESMWARHPSFSVLMMENSLPRHYAASGLQYILNPNVTLGLEGGIEKLSYDYKDYYSALSWGVKGVEAFASAGCSIRWNRLISTFTAYSFSNYGANDIKLSIAEPTAYYTDFRIRDIASYQADFQQHRATLRLSVEPGLWGIINLNLFYSSRKAASENLFSGIKRNDFTSSLELRLKVY
ncbi:MAG TPA: hypothetical protein VHO43_10875 [Ignavibacteriales bacterium]|nr:hypothetical protein [Ignavibacteriales bacterium]